MTIDEIIANATLQNVFEKGRNWAIKGIDSVAEATRIQELSRIETMSKKNKK